MIGPPANILVIKLRYIGDVLLTTPFLRVLRESLPTSHITVLVNPGTESVLHQNPNVDHIAILPRGNWAQQIQFFQGIRSRHFDCVIDLTDGDRSALLTFLSGARLRIGFNHEGRWRGKAYSWCVNGQYGTTHMLNYHARALIPLGIEPRVCSPEIVLTDQERQSVDRLLTRYALHNKKWVMLHPAARYWFKAWAPQRFAEVGDALIRDGYHVVVVGSESEQELVNQVMHSAQQTFVSLVGQTTLRELAGLMQHCRLFVGNDAGPMHMAAAVGCPVLALFGPTDPAVWGPWGTHCQTIYKGLDCRECFHPGCQRGEASCMNLIGVGEVLQAARRLLSIKEGMGGRDEKRKDYGKGGKGA